MNLSQLCLIIASILVFISAVTPFFYAPAQPSRVHVFRWGMFFFVLSFAINAVHLH